MLIKRFGNFFIKRNILSVVNKAVIKPFTIKTDKLKELINNEVKYEKENYAPVDENEIVQFKNSTKFEFIEREDKTKMELRKREGSHEVIVTFNSRPPMNQDEEQPNQEESKFLFNFI